MFRLILIKILKNRLKNINLLIIRDELLVEVCQVLLCEHMVAQQAGHQTKISKILFI